MSKARRLLTSVRFKYAGIIKRIATCSNCIILVIFLLIAVIVFSVHEKETENEVSPSKLDMFKSADYVKEKDSTQTKLRTVYEVDKFKSTERNVTKSVSKSTSIASFLTSDFKKSIRVTEKPTDISMESWNAVKNRNIMPAIKIFYKGKPPRPKSRTTKVQSGVTKQNKITYRDVFEALAHPRQFPTTTEDYEFRDVPPRPGLNDWIQANNPRDKTKFLVYSAYWDERFDNNNNVRVMAVMITKNPPTVYCRLLMPDGTFNDVPVVRKIMNEHWRLTYASYFLSCEVSKNLPPPSRVLLSLHRNFTSSALLPVFNNKEDTSSPRGDIAVCVKPLHYYYDRGTWLAEFIELHRILGAEHFFFYNHSVGQNVDTLLRHYMEQKIVSVLPWNLPVRSQKEIRTEGIFSSLNDCVLRTMHLFHYVIILDFDEYIIPREHDNYLEMLEKLEEDNKRIRGKPGSFVFRNTFFYLYWENDTTSYGVEPEKPPDWTPYFVTQYKTRRLATSMKVGSRSKYILVPERVIEVGNHVVWRHASGSRSIQVPESMALLHHYRICEFGGFSCLKKPSLVDRTANKFGRELLNRVLQQCSKVYPTLEGKCPVSPPLGSPW